MDILVIEDDKELNEFFVTALEAEGHTVTSFYSGVDALEQNEFQYDIALIDIMMKDVDGIETCKRIKEVNSSLPICMVTASMDTEHVLRSFRLGANGYIVKPFDLDELFLKIDELANQSY